MPDQSKIIQQQLTERIEKHDAIQISAGNSKAFYAQDISGEKMDVLNHCGIIQYEPAELVITARCGTPLIEIEKTLFEHNQMLTFEPPCFSNDTTFGGALASGLSGPRRPFTGAARDYTLGITMLNGRAEQLKLGGQVIKNVAGYDLSRLLVGSMGTLGIILDASVKVLPKPDAQITLAREMPHAEALAYMNTLCAKNLPITASCFDGQQLLIRLSGTQTAITSAQTNIGGDPIKEQDTYWNTIKNHQHDFFNSKKRIWRISLPASTPTLIIEGEQLIEWRGALRWLSSSEAPEKIRALVKSHNGHASIFKNAQTDDLVFEPLTGKLRELHLNIKLAMDPKCLFNPGRMYEDF